MCIDTKTHTQYNKSLTILPFLGMYLYIHTYILAHTQALRQNPQDATILCTS